MSFDWRPESKDRYFRKAEAAVKAAGFDDILQISKEQFAISFPSSRERSRYISNRFRETGKHADGGRQRKASQGCRSSPEGVTSSAGKRKPFLIMPIWF